MARCCRCVTPAPAGWVLGAPETLIGRYQDSRRGRLERDRADVWPGFDARSVGEIVRNFWVLSVS